jgi:hypothetical protein
LTRIGPADFFGVRSLPNTLAYSLPMTLACKTNKSTPGAGCYQLFGGWLNGVATCELLAGPLALGSPTPWHAAIEPSPVPRRTPVPKEAHQHQGDFAPLSRRGITRIRKQSYATPFHQNREARRSNVGLGRLQSDPGRRAFACRRAGSHEKRIVNADDLDPSVFNLVLGG